MTCQYYDLQINQGDAYDLNLTILDDFGNPIDLTPYTLKSYIRRNFGDTGFFDLNPQTFNPTSGQITMSLSSNDTTGIPVMMGVYDLKLISSSGELRALAGRAYIHPFVTF